MSSRNALDNEYILISNMKNSVKVGGCLSLVHQEPRKSVVVSMSKRRLLVETKGIMILKRPPHLLALFQSLELYPSIT